MNAPDDNSLDRWGQWCGRKYAALPSFSPCLLMLRHYSLHVVQHPLRARMCGFGDKVCPTLPTSSISPFPAQGSPTACPRRRRQDGRPQRGQLDRRCRASHLPLPRPLTLNVCSELDSSFFLVTVDLWSADGKREMNLVLHPSSSTDRYVSTVAAKPKKSRGAIPTTTSPRAVHPSPPSSHSTPNPAPEPPRPALDMQVSTPPSCRADKYKTVR
jgi:hypothetical protein